MTDLRREAQISTLLRRLLTRGGLGIDVAVANLATTHAVTFEKDEPDAVFGVLVVPSWDTTVFVTDKATTGFTANFGSAAGATDTIDYLIFRSE